MGFYSWENCPTTTRKQVRLLTKLLQTELRGNLVGIYLHGSLAMGSFNLLRSDVDILVLTKRAISADSKRTLITLLLAHSGQPHPIEITFLHRKQIKPWRHPTPYELHYSETWREKFSAELASSHWNDQNLQPQTDYDLASHISTIIQRGVVLRGQAIATTFQPIPTEDYIDSIKRDLQWCKAKADKLGAYCVLNACRTYMFMKNGLIGSKRQGGEWALTELPDDMAMVVLAALANYASAYDETHIAPDQVRRIVEFVETEMNASEVVI